jgi:glycyl-tRNA synthetase beta chain
MKNLLFEIGLEELPASFVNPTLNQIREKSTSLLNDANIDFDKILTYSTPRRITLVVEGLAERQSDIVEEIKGPPKKIAIDSNGELTKAGEGFLRKFSASIEDVVFEQVGNQDYLYLHNKIIGKDVIEVLPSLLSELISSLNFPKPMKWGSLNTRFARPIRWIVALLDDKILNFEYADVKASNFTMSHRFLGKGKLSLNDASDYLEVLEDNYVLADISKREALIQDQITKIEKENSFTAIVKKHVLDEVVNLVEYPTAFVGSFDKDYLSLPDEVVITPMQDHQRYFPVRDKSGQLLPFFIGVRNGDTNHIENVMKGNEKVLVARLSDAKFFYDEDLKKPLLSYTEKLKSVIYQEDIGSYYDKVQRVEKLALKIYKSLEMGLIEEDLSVAAKLIKADLTTQMVFEFPELQGIIGHKYALAQNYDNHIAKAISEHYMPTSSNGDLPESDYGSILSIADKLDTIVSCLAVGLNASGSQDPYALRRQAVGIIRILIENNYRLNLKELYEFSYDLLSSKKFSKEELWEELWKFFNTRIRSVLDVYSYDVLDSVLASNNYVISDLASIAKAISRFKSSQNYSSLITGYKRANNLAEKAAKDFSLDSSLLKEEYELKLYNDYKRINSSFENYLANFEYFEALEIFSSLEEPINQFFDNVMVMVDDNNIKNNRLALLQNIVELIKPLADLSLLVE